jgi:hypothetical protein
METIELEPLTEFFDAIRSPLTKDRYERRLGFFFKFLKLEGDLKAQARAFCSKAKLDSPWATYQINEYMRTQKARAERGEIAESTLAGFWKPIKLFTEQNDILLNWKKITRRIPPGRHFANDRAPTREEIISILGYPDRRIKPAVLIMVSSGIRVGSWDYLKWKHLVPIERDGSVIAARLIVYSGTKDEYKTFVSSEAYKSAKEWMDFRDSHGEKISGESWLLRDLWNATSKQRGNAKIGLAAYPKQLKSAGVKRLMERALWAQGVRKALEEGKRRHEFQTDHGFRKFFNTICDRYMKTLYVEFLMGHNTGLKESYNRAQQDELLSEYLKAAPELTFLEQPKIENNEGVEDLKEEIRQMKVDRELEQERNRKEMQELREVIKKALAKN